MNDTFEKICKKHAFSDQAKVELKKFVENEIVKALDVKKLIEREKDILIGKETKVTGSKESVLKKIGSKSKPTSSDGICVGKKADGKPCTFKAKSDSDYCGRHDPNKEKSTGTKTGSKPRTKKETSHTCHATIPATGKKCIQPATVKPKGADFHYCKRHSEKWIEFEKEPDVELAASDEEAAEEEADEEVEEEVEAEDAAEEAEEEAEEAEE